MRNSQDKKSLFSTFSRVYFKSKLSFWLFLFVFIFLCSHVPMFPCSNALAWTPPQSPPPQDNVPQPLNTGPTSQAKIGDFTVGKNIPITGAVFGAYATNPGVNFVFTTNGQVGIGTTAPTTNLSVNGNVQSSIYYDRENTAYYLDLSGAIMPYSLLLNKSVGIGTDSPDGKLEIRQTGTADIFNLYDNTTNVFTVLDGGNVGIGISAPTGLLDVNNKFIVTAEQITMNVPLNLAAAGDISIASDLQFTNPTASYIKSYAPLYIEAGDPSQNVDLTLRGSNLGKVIVDDNFKVTGEVDVSNNRITNLATPTEDTDAATKGYVDDIEYWQVVGTYLYPASMDYTVGIGTTTPSVDLQIHDSGNASELLLSSDADKKSMIYFEDGQTGIYEPANSEDLRFWTGSADQVTITSDGKVGIGTTSPGQKLEVYHATNDNIATFESGDVFSSIKVKDPTTTSYLISTQGTTQLGQTFLSSPLNLVVTTAGNVGIGTTSPRVKLDVTDSGSVVAGDYFLATPATTRNAAPDYGIGISNLKIDGESYNSVQVAGAYGITFVASSDTPKMVVTRSGNVGIGTTSPSEALTIGNAGKLQINSAGDDKYVNLYHNDTDATLVVSSGDFVVKPAGDEMYLWNNSQTYKFSLYSGSARTVQLNAGGDSYFNSGNVGIGTTSPSAKLDIKDTTSGSASGQNILTLQSNYAAATVGSGGRIVFKYQGGTQETADIRGYTFGSGATGLAFGTGWDAVTPKMVIDNSGNVGIGTTGPGYKLEVAGTGKFRDATYFGNASTNKGLISWGTGTFVINATSGNDLQFGSNGTSAQMVLKAGNVGIGTTTIRVPAYTKLDVEGGDIYIDDFSGTDDKFAATVGYVKSTSGASVTGEPNYIPKYGADGLLTETTTPIYELNDYIGIGTTVPAAVLDVAGQIRVGAYSGDANAVPKAYIDDNFLPIAGGEPGGTGDAFIQGGNSFGALATLGTNDNYDLTFETNNSRKMTIETSGNVGIGTTDPDAKLDVRSDVASYPAIYASSSVYDGVQGISTASGRYGIQGVSDTGAARGVYGLTGSSTGAGVYGENTNGTSGYGVYGLSNAGIAIYGSTTSGYAGIFMGGNVGIGTTTPGAKLSVLGVDSLSTSFAANISGLTGTGLVVKNNGNVGIGTTGPSVKLQIAEGAADVGLQLSNTATGHDINSGFQLSVDTSKNAYLIQRESANLWFYTANTIRMQLGATGGLSLGSTYYSTDPGSGNMIIQGNVGIGTTVPQAKLDIRGSSEMQRITSSSGNGYMTFYENATVQGYFGHSTDAVFSNNITDAMVIRGTTAVQLGDNSVATLTIDGGKVAIGTTVPTYLLDVRGAVAVGTAGATNQIHYVATPTTDTDAATKGYVDDASVDHAATADYATTSGSADHATYANSSLRALYLGDSFNVTADAQGKVGIGTVTPSAKLNVKAVAAEVIVEFTDDDGTNVMQIDANGNVIISL